LALVVETPAGHDEERKYVLSTILGDWFGLDWSHRPAERTDTRILLAGHAGELQLPDVLFSYGDSAWLTAKTLPSSPIPTWDAHELNAVTTVVMSELPVIYGDQIPRLVTNGNSIYIPVDVFGSAFFMLSRYEEVVNHVLDVHGRFPAASSIAYQNGFLERPIIDEYAELLWAAMSRLWPSLARTQHQYRLVLTHDVDRPFGVCGEPLGSVLRRFGGDLVHRRSPIYFAKRLASVVLPGQAKERYDPNNTFDWIMTQSERNDLRSEFYFMADVTGTRRYDPFAPHIQRLLQRIHARGHRIGLHPSYETLGRPDLLATEADTLRRALDGAGIDQPLRSGRQHYLRWNAERTWNDWEEAGLQEDSSVGYPDHVGFRAGTSRPYHGWSWKAQKKLHLLERPLIAMDATLLSNQYMALSPENAEERLRLLSQRVRAVRGEFVSLWHNDSIIGRKGMYKRFLEDCRG